MSEHRLLITTHAMFATVLGLLRPFHETAVCRMAEWSKHGHEYFVEDDGGRKI